MKQTLRRTAATAALAIPGLALTGVAFTGLAFAQSAAPAAPRVPAIAGGFPAPQQLQGLPDAVEQTLQLVDIPKPAGPRVALFNGKDLSQFTPWLGYANGTMFPTDANDKPLGARGLGDVFKVVEEDGWPAVYLSGRIWGSLNTVREYGNYHLSLWFKYGQQWHADVPRNTGVLYHSYGPHGAFAGTWMSAVEFEVAQDLNGMVATLGREMTATIELAQLPGPGPFGLGNYRYMVGGKPQEIHLPTLVKPNRDHERPVGQWNRLDLYVAGDQAVHVVNGQPVLALSRLARTGADGVSRPLTRGKIQLESEGTEVYMRDIWLEPIRSVPQVRMAK